MKEVRYEEYIKTARAKFGRLRAAVENRFDKRVARETARAVAQTAQKTGVARHLSKDHASYRI